MDVISADKIAAHTRFLADDLLEGRGPGTRGGQLAARYMATQFALLGLTPVGDAGTFYQRVPMVNVTARPESTFVFSTGKDSQVLAGGQDYTATCQTAKATVDIAGAPLVFVGYGIHAPELGWDDYAGVDVKGKVVLMFVNQPPSPEVAGAVATPFTGKALTYYGRWTYKYEEAARQGAVGAILIHQTQMAAYPWSVIGSRWGRKTAYLAEPTNPRVGGGVVGAVRGGSSVACGEWLDITELMVRARTPGFRAVALRSTLTARLVSTVEPFDGQNVVGGCLPRRLSMAR